MQASRIAGTRVLFVDDFRPLVTSTRRILEQLGCRVWVAASLSEASALLDLRFDVAVLDGSLPDGDGAALVGPLRAGHPHIGIVLVSGAFDGGESCSPGSRLQYLPKPFLGRDLERAMLASMAGDPTVEATASPA